MICIVIAALSGADPTELVITARAGTPLVAIEAALESAGQMLPCEPPHYGEEATWGGMVACGLAGPRRPSDGSVRDFVLGTRIITGAGKHLRFGGEVMKNVAGYDLSRLMAGSYGCLGVLTEDLDESVTATARLPEPLRREISLQEAMNEIAQWQLQPLPISGLCYFDNALWIRLEGGEGSVKAARELLGGEEVAGQFWQQLREQQLPFFCTRYLMAHFITQRCADDGFTRRATDRLGRSVTLAEIDSRGRSNPSHRPQRWRSCDPL
ncbi:glycolate oxidase subunit GlcE [Escherichia coli]